MRLFEIVAPPSEFAITNKFASNYSKFVKKHPDLSQELMKFCIAKREGRKYGKRDKPFTGSPLAGFSHAHLNLKGGLLIVIYNRVGGTIRLYELLPHKGYEGSNIPALSRWLNSIPDSALTIINPDVLFDPDDESVGPELSDEQKEQIMNAIYELISEDAFDILDNAVNRNVWDELIEWLRMYVPDLDENALFATFGGQEVFKDMIVKGLKDYGKLDDFLKNNG